MLRARIGEASRPAKRSKEIGAIAISGVAACGGASDDWLDALRARLDGNRRLLGDLLRAQLPQAVYRMPEAGYLAWIDLSAYGWGDDPAVRIQRDAKVALHHGPQFGAEGVGFVRLNFGCAPDVLTDAVTRIGALAPA